jgi:probable HAF family extracellular repeat protein
VKKRNRRSVVLNVEQVEARLLLSTAPQFTVKDLGIVRSISGINNSNQIVATNNSSQAILSAPNGGQFSTFIDGPDTVGTSVNDSGSVAGSFRGDSHSNYNAYYYLPAFGSFALDFPVGTTESKGNGINNSNQVTGYFTTNGVPHAFLSDASDSPSFTIHDLGASSVGNGVNDSGQVTGWSSAATPGLAHAFLSEPNGGALHDLGTLPGGLTSFGLAVNKFGQVVGYSDNATFHFHAFLSDPNGGALHDLGVLPGSLGSVADDVNDSGEVVGHVFSTNNTEHAFVYVDGMMYDLNTLMPANSGFTAVDAVGVNNSGQIAVQALDSTSNVHALLLTPVPPEPIAPVVTWVNPADIVYGTPLSATQLDATASVPGTFIYTPEDGTVLHAGEAQTLSATFIPNDTVDYTTVTTTALINVLQAPLTITANNATKVYGADLPSLTASYSGFVNGDTVDSLDVQATATTDATTSSQVGSYVITVTGAVNPDYAITYKDGAITVTPAPLTVTANDVTKVQGQVNPPLSGTIVGLVNGDTDTATYSTTATDSSQVGSYPITPTLTDSNYNITFVNGTLTVTAPVNTGIGCDRRMM